MSAKDARTFGLFVHISVSTSYLRRVAQELQYECWHSQVEPPSPRLYRAKYTAHNSTLLSRVSSRVFEHIVAPWRGGSMKPSYKQCPPCEPILGRIRLRVSCGQQKETVHHCIRRVYLGALQPTSLDMPPGQPPAVMRPLHLMSPVCWTSLTIAHVHTQNQEEGYRTYMCSEPQRHGLNQLEASKRQQICCS